ncbi:MAG: hypothetical protein V1774_10120 [Candidatus Eisenbacteria bacterium]
MAQEFKSSAEFSDVVILTLVKKDRRDKIEKMMLTRGLPVLMDTFDGFFEETYSAVPSRAFHFFDRQGCLVPNQLETGPKIMVEREELHAFLRGMAADG